MLPLGDVAAGGFADGVGEGHDALDAGAAHVQCCAACIPQGWCQMRDAAKMLYHALNAWARAARLEGGANAGHDEEQGLHAT